MARNEEKAQSMLHRYLRSKAGSEGDGGAPRPRRRRPYLATLCDDADEAVRWLRQVDADVRRDVADIQNPGLSEERAGELNEQINKLLRERRHWRARVLHLGGELEAGEGDDPFSRRRKKRKFNEDEEDGDDDVFEHGGTLYFGAAKNLPGVRELMDAEREERERRRRRNAGEDVDDGVPNQEDNDVRNLNERLSEFYYSGVEEDQDDSSKVKDSEATMRKVERDFEAREMERQVIEWEKKHGGDVEFVQRYGENAPWDDSYLQYINSGAREADESEREAAMQRILLERKKADALQLLEQH